LPRRFDYPGASEPGRVRFRETRGSLKSRSVPSTVRPTHDLPVENDSRERLDAARGLPVIGWITYAGNPARIRPRTSCPAALTRRSPVGQPGSHIRANACKALRRSRRLNAFDRSPPRQPHGDRNLSLANRRRKVLEETSNCGPEQPSVNQMILSCPILTAVPEVDVLPPSDDPVTGENR
jgi:hypothetical protein